MSEDIPIKVSVEVDNVLNEVNGKFLKNKTSPQDVAKALKNKKLKKSVVCKVNNQVWDLFRPLEGDSVIQFFSDFNDEVVQHTFWHSSAHIMGYAMEKVYGGENGTCHLTVGPPLDDGGFYYDCHLLDKEGNVRSILPSDFPSIESAYKSLASGKTQFSRREVTRDQAKEHFQYNKFKLELIDMIPQNDKITLYKCGDFTDLCRGPHVPHGGVLRHFMVTKASSCMWMNKPGKQLQRLYGMSFPDAKGLKDYKQFLKDAKQRDHRNVGIQQKLFFFHEWSPGCAFWLPHGTKVFGKILKLLRIEYRKRGFQEVITPQIFNQKLWLTSGHWYHYAENMFSMVADNGIYSLKPMNCPSHCLMFRHELRSHNDLPLRLADFGVLHRNEASGALNGLTRVRKFQQDDAHIFCRPDQLDSEILGCLDFMAYIYDIFGLDYRFELSTRPDSYLGTIELWDSAESSLQKALQGTKKPWKLNPGDGAFYGPKIDVHVKDCLNRFHQCATIQVDFNLPTRFDLKYQLPISPVSGDAKAKAKGGVAPESKKASDAPTDVPADPSQPSDAPQPAQPDEAPTETTSSSAPSVVASDVDIASHAVSHADPNLKTHQNIRSCLNSPDAKNLAASFVPHVSHLNPSEERPIIIHRAICGSIERMTAMLIEHHAGKWPFWLSPRQIMIIPVHPDVNEYAKEVCMSLIEAGFDAECDVSGKRFQKKIATYKNSFNYTCLVGNEEKKNGTLNVRRVESKAKPGANQGEIMAAGYKTVQEELPIHTFIQECRDLESKHL